jgi:hypothetical protein
MYDDDPTQDRHFNLEAAARYLGRSAAWLRAQLHGADPPPGFKLGKSWLLKKSELDTWIEHLRAGADPDQVSGEDLR